VCFVAFVQVAACILDEDVVVAVDHRKEF